MESEVDWHEHLTGLRESLTPTDYLENYLVERIAYSSWQLKRVEQYETHLLALRQESVIEEAIASTLYPQGNILDAFLEDTPDTTIDEHILWLRRLKELAKQLCTSPQTTQLSADDHQMLDEGLTLTLSMLAELPTLKMKEFAPCYSPTDNASDWLEAFRRSPLGHLFIDGKPWLLLRFAERELGRLNSGKARLSSTIESLRKERLILDEQTLARVARYETQHRRQFLQFLHELQALQATRHGEPAPLARLEVQVS
jgi:hypothetical protein